ADRLAIDLGDPAALALSIETAQKFRRELGDQRLELLVPAIFLGVKRAVPADHPAHIADAVRAQKIGDLALGFAAQKALDRFHAGEQLLLLRFGRGTQHRADLAFGSQLERGEGLASRRGEREQDLPPIIRRWRFHQKPALLEALKGPAQIAGVEAELLAQSR